MCTTVWYDGCKRNCNALIAHKLMDQFWENQKAAERGGYGGERYEQLEFQKKVAQSYLKLCDASWKVINLSFFRFTLSLSSMQLSKNDIWLYENSKYV